MSQLNHVYHIIQLIITTQFVGVRVFWARLNVRWSFVFWFLMGHYVMRVTRNIRGCAFPPSFACEWDCPPVSVLVGEIARLCSCPSSRLSADIHAREKNCHPYGWCVSINFLCFILKNKYAYSNMSYEIHAYFICLRRPIKLEGHFVIFDSNRPCSPLPMP